MNRLDMARAILQEAQQPVAACPFLAAVPLETRATLEQQHPNPHDLPEAQLLELAAQHGYDPNTHQFPNPDSLTRRGEACLAQLPNPPQSQSRENPLMGIESKLSPSRATTRVAPTVESDGL